ncbi:CHAP domain-containing protein [Rarobacter incanus]|uniref:CHAP domain-containing protein n=1 Tax=Rarobacter incanus TaxID=153494 RepID=A0A542SPN2_9MICO|nr:CHAP domain-containing protein [Rarobacter incanus]TQK76581.1 CHAP domain-containing protein [Rarobacter incanus]
MLLPGLATTAPAQAANYEVLCTGYDGCVAAGYPDHGYKQARSSMYWNMFSGHNCTNYAAYKVIRDGGPATRPWTGGGNATYWGTSVPQLVDQAPAVGAIAWWLGGAGGMGSAGHVAYVERVVSNDEVIISEDNWSGDFHWKRIKRASSVWPSGFLHFTADAAGNPTGALDAATSPVRGQIRVTGWAVDPDSAGAAVGIRVVVGAPAGGAGVIADESSVAATPNANGAQGSSTNPSSPSGIASGADATGAISSTVGFDITVDTQTGGKLPVYVYAQNVAGTLGRAVLLGGRTVKVTKPLAIKAGTVALTGKTRVGATVKAAVADWPEGVVLDYQWRREGKTIKGATTRKYLAQPDDKGKRLSVVVVASRPGYKTATKKSVATAVVMPGKLASTTPKIKGKAAVGAKLTVKTGAWTPDVTFKYQWYRGGKKIAGATKATYKVKKRDRGATIAVRIAGKKKGYVTAKVWAKVKRVHKS